MFKTGRIALYAWLALGLSSPAYSAPAIESVARQALVADVETGTVLYNKNAYDKMFPASMTKMMTAHVVFDYLKAGKFKKEDTFPVSEKAWRMQGSKMFVHVNDRVNIDDLLHGIVIQSGNDSCVVVAEGIAGSEEDFATIMNRYAAELGMKSTHFKNSTGWPDDEHVTSPYDLYLLARDTIVNFPEYYPLYGELSYTYNNIKQPNRNLLLTRNLGVDGLKTGHTEVSGYGITISGVNKDDGRRVIVVVNGLNSEAERATEAERLLIYGYRNFENKTIFAKGSEVAKADVWFGESDTVSLVPAKDARMTIAKSGQDNFKFTVKYKGPVAAPIAKDQPIGELIITADGRESQTIPLIAGEEVAKLSGMARIAPALKYYLGK